MKSNFIISIAKVLLLASLFFSCSSNLDFDQVNDLKLEPVLVANLAYFDVSANQLLDDGGNNIIYDTRDFDVFKNKFFKEHLKKAEFNFEVENNINRSFILRMELMDANNRVVQTITFNVPAYTGSPNIITYPTEVFENARLDLLKQTYKIQFALLIEEGPPLNKDSVGNIKLRSNATVYMEIQ